MPTNKFALFITNTPGEPRGSSLYAIGEGGTIRVSGANDKARKATTFIRPFTIGYFSYARKGVMYDKPYTGLYPFEAETNKPIDLTKLIKEDDGHKGNAISELVNIKDLLQSSFQPKTWIGSAHNGIDWSIAVFEVINAMLHISKTQSFARLDKIISEKDEPKVESPRFLY